MVVLSDDLEFHLDANGEGEVRLPMGSSMAHLRAARARVGPDFEFIVDNNYDPTKPYEVYRVTRRVRPANRVRDKFALAAASVVMSAVGLKVAGVAWEHAVQIAQHIQEFA